MRSGLEENSPHGPHRLGYLPCPKRRRSLLGSLVIDEHGTGVTIVARIGVIEATIFTLGLLIFVGVIAPLLFLPRGVSYFHGMRFEIPETPYIRILPVVLIPLILGSVILRLRLAVIPYRIECFKHGLEWSWPKLLTRGWRQLRPDQIRQIYGGEDKSSEGTHYYVGIVDEMGHEHRLLEEYGISRTEAIQIGRLFRAAIGQPTTEQDQADFK